MNRRLLWKLRAIVAVGAVILFTAVTHMAQRTEEAMSFIAPAHRQTLIHYGRQAEALLRAGELEALRHWLTTLQAQEDTWAAVVGAEVWPVAGTLSPRFVSEFGLGRDVNWKIHLYFHDNPIMEIPFEDEAHRFLIQLPQRMRPGYRWDVYRLLLQFALPLGVMLIVCAVLYRHLAAPIQRLQQASRQLSAGRYDVRVSGMLGSRNDEIADLAHTFDAMAERIGHQVLDQRQRLADMSHELRTPLTRVEMAAALAERGGDGPLLLGRIREECEAMRRLVEDALTLSWLENETPSLRDESLDLTELLDSVIDDARFEFPDHEICVALPPEAPLAASNHRALGQAVENVLRNALAHTPTGKRVDVTLERVSDGGPQAPVDSYRLCIADGGPGVPESMLERIFEPFFRIAGREPAAAASASGGHAPATVTEAGGRRRTGFGLGLALARRQVQATGGTLQARNGARGGLEVRFQLPATRAAVLPDADPSRHTTHLVTDVNSVPASLRS